MAYPDQVSVLTIPFLPLLYGPANGREPYRREVSQRVWTWTETISCAVIHVEEVVPAGAHAL